jgi:hypothetical protein
VSEDAEALLEARRRQGAARARAFRERRRLGVSSAAEASELSVEERKRRLEEREARLAKEARERVAIGAREAATAKATARQQRQQEAIEAARVHIRPAEGSTPAEKLECLRVRSLERLCELASIPIDKIDAALLPVILPTIGNVATRALMAAIRVDEGSLKREDEDLVGRLLERFAELRRLEGAASGRRET